MKIQETWRIHSREEFEDRAIDYLTTHFMNIQKIIEDDKLAPVRYFSAEKTKIIQNKIKKLRETMIDTPKDKDAIIKDLLEVCLEDVKEWSAFSTNPQSRLDDIMLRMVITVLYNKSYVCFIYISRNDNLIKEFIDDATYVTSGIFRFEDWDDEHVNAVVDCITTFTRPEDSPEIRRLYGITNKDDLVHVPATHKLSELGFRAPKIDLIAINKKCYQDIKDKYSLVIEKFARMSEIEAKTDGYDVW